MNIYVYANANPIRFTDPLGLMPVCNLLSVLNTIPVNYNEERNVKHSVGITYPVLRPVAPELGLEMDLNRRRMNPSVGMAFQIWMANTFIRSWELWQIIGMKQLGYYECKDTLKDNCGNSYVKTTFRESWDERISSNFLGNYSSITTSYSPTNWGVGF